MNLIGSLQALNQKMMYTDRMTVYRQVSIIDEQGADDFALRPVYENIPCRLAQSQKARLNIGEGAAESIQQMKIFTMPELTVLANDVVEVCRMGQIYRMCAALPFRYPTHQEIPVDVDENVKEEAIDDETGRV